MDKVSQFVKDSILEYPLIFRDRLDVFVHLFTVIGNGYEWVDGEPVDAFGRERKGLKKCKRDTDTHELVAESLQHRKYLHELDFIDANIDEIASSKAWSYDREKNWMGSHYIENPATDYARFFTADKDNLEQCWREALIEFGGVWSHFFFVRSLLYATDIEFNRKPRTAQTLILSKNLKLTAEQKSDVKKYNLITKRCFELHTPEMIELKFQQNKMADEIIEKVKKERLDK